METRKIRVGPRGTGQHASGEDEFMSVVASPGKKKQPISFTRNTAQGQSTANNNGEDDTTSTSDSPTVTSTLTTSGASSGGRSYRWIRNSSNFNRAAILNPGRSVHNARFDTAKLANYYWYLQCCEVHGAESARTYLDIYDNHIELNRVSSAPWGCCCYSDHPRSASYDGKKWFTNRAYTARCCHPICPLPCLHCWGVCGDVMILEGGTCCRPRDTDIVPGFYHWTNCLCSVAAVYGLAEGAGAEACDALNRNVEVVAKGNMNMR